jgi:hypothetical protein
MCKKKPFLKAMFGNYSVYVHERSLLKAYVMLQQANLGGYIFFPTQCDHFIESKDKGIPHTHTHTHTYISMSKSLHIFWQEFSILNFHYFESFIFACFNMIGSLEIN